MSGIDWLAIGVATLIGGGLPLILELVLVLAAVPERYHTVFRVPGGIVAVLLAWTYSSDIADFIRQQGWQ